ncbi:MAG TPA: carbohydrate kinase [Planctomycetota bacterium]|jgi:fructokinase|nr:carbohydrate kinase [Planctomycetota bacterium]
MKTVVSFGETLWDLLPAGPVLGGAPCNLAYRVNSLGERGVIVTRLGRDELGRKAAEAIGALGMDTRSIQWDAAHATGTVPVTLDARGIPEYTILKDVAYDYIEPAADLRELAATADCLCFGSLCQRSERSARTLMELLSAAPKALKFFDVNLRKDCFSRPVLERSFFKADILKINDAEALDLARMFELSARTPETVAAEVLRRWGLKACVVTLGADGAYAVAGSDEARVPGWNIEVVDTIGSGDAFSAAFVTCWLRGRPLKDCVFFGNALGALVARTKGATTPIGTDEINRFCGRNI